MRRMMAVMGAGLILAGCGGGSDSARDSTAVSPQNPSNSIADEPGPNLAIPDRPPPKRLIIKDLKEGTGKAAKAGDEITVMYIGRHWHGGVYSNSWTYGGPPSFILGSGRLIRGFDLGVRGMKAGGRRRIIVPTALMNRPGFKPEKVPPSQTLVFLVDMLKVR